MPSESIIWTAIPHGVSGQGENRRIHVSIVASLNLDDASPSNRLGAFPEISHWTQRVADSVTKFEIGWRTAAGSSGSTDALAVLPQTLNPAVWDRLVWEPADIEVRPRSVRSLTGHQVGTFPAASGLSAIRANYQNAALSAISGQPISALTDDTLASLRVLRSVGEETVDEEWNAPDGNRYLVRAPGEALRIANARAADRRGRLERDPSAFAGPDPVWISAFEQIDSRFAKDSHADDGDSSIAIAQVLAYHQQTMLASQLAAKEARDAPGPPEFHELMTAIGNYRDLSRRLGLIFEIDLPVTQLDIVDRGFIRAVPQWDPPLTAAAFTPWTAIDGRSGRMYSSLQHPSKIDRGFLVSSSAGVGKLELLPIDLHSASLKLGLMSQQPDADGLLPTLRSTGFSLLRAGNAAIVRDANGRAVRNDIRMRERNDVNPGDIDLYAEDVNRGYRLDVQQFDSKSWQSVHRLDRTFTSGDESWEVQEEGFQQVSAIDAVAPDGSPDLLMEDTISTWAGWSPSAPRPGMSLAPDGVPVAPPESLDLGGIEVRQRVTRGSLPRLRFGETYRFRVRTVDLAGNARDLNDEAENPLAILPGHDDTLTCLRFEPLEAPVLLQRAVLGDGEAIDRLVVRSSSELSPRAFARRNRASEFANQRHLAPAKTTQLVAEMHGKFDGAFGTGPGTAEAAARAYEIARREGGTLGGSMPSKGASPDPAVAPIYPEPVLEISYLPDPMGRGVALRNLPGPANGKWGVINSSGVLDFRSSSAIEHGNVATISYGTEERWPDLQPLRIQLDGSTGFGLPRWNAEQRLLTVALPPGEMFTVGLRTSIDFAALDQLGIWQWAEERIIELGDESPLSNEDSSIRRQRATAGDFWFITPERRLQLVHAVQQPLESPEFVTISADRPADATYAEIKNRLVIHARTTARLDLNATWTDTIDPVTSHPYTVTKQALVRSQQINLFEGHDDWTRKDFREASWKQKDSQMLTDYGALENPGFPTAKPVSPEGAPLPVPSNPTAPMRHEFGDTRHRMVTYQLVAGTRFREYFPESVTNDPKNISKVSDEFTVNIPSATRPPAPSVPYALPAFRWRTPATPALDQERQRWGGIRVYLERPWYSSGEGEKLAVVLWSGAEWPPDPALGRFITRWGADPIWSPAGGTLAQRPLPEHFPLRDRAFDNQRFSLPGFGTGATPPFAVAAHDVTFPEDDDVISASRCWCDIQIEPGGSYTPFVRLAVARFQPDSIDDAQLSAVALTDFVQIAAHRSVSLTRQDASELAVTVAGEATGSGFDAIGHQFPANQIEVALERRVAGLPDEFGWEPAAAPASVASSLAAGVLWQGTIALPAAGTTAPHRLVIREFEQLPSDDAPAGSLGRRLVFADTIELP